MSDENLPRCFVIMPISDQPGYPAGHFTKVYNQIFIPAIEAAGYKPDRVDGDNICDSIIVKIFERIQSCDMALCDLSSRNPNVLYELGLRQAYNKPVVLVKDEKTERIFDVSGINTILYDSDRLYENVLEARKKITQALEETRDGKDYSLVKIVKANEAKFPEGDLSVNEKTEIMFKTIMDELARVKNNKIEYKYIADSSDVLLKGTERDLAMLELDVLKLLDLQAEDFDEKSIELRRRILVFKKCLEDCNLSKNQKIILDEKLMRIKGLLESYIVRRMNNN